MMELRETLETEAMREIGVGHIIDSLEIITCNISKLISIAML